MTFSLTSPISSHISIQIHFKPGEFTTHGEIDHKLKEMGRNQRRGQTYTNKAINEMTYDMFANRREWVPQIGIVITDGESIELDKTRLAAADAKAHNITMFAIGVGR